MPASLTYPGVYVEEISSGVRTITGVATSITAFLGRALQGQTNEPVTINSFGDFERQFGGLHVDYPMSYAVRDFYLNGGSQAIIVRLYQLEGENEDEPDDSDNENDGDDSIADTNEENPEDIAASKKTGKAELTVDGLKLTAKSPGEWGRKLRATIDVEIDASEDDKKRLEVGEGDLLFNLILQLGNDSDAPREVFLNLTTTEKSTQRIDRVLNEESIWVDANWSDIKYALSKAEEDSASGSGSNLKPLSKTKAAVKAYKATLEKKKKLAEASKELAEVKAATPRNPAKIKEAENKLATANNELATANNELTTANNELTTVTKTVGGGDSQTLAPKTYQGNKDEKKGLYALEKADLFNLLCIPSDTREGDTPKEVYREAMKYCADRRALLIVDPPANWGKIKETAAQAARDGISELELTGTAARNAALYFPRVVQKDPLREGQLDTFVPCGIIAGRMAYTDATRGVWKAPAGLDASLNGIQGLQVNLTDAENGMLNPLGINCLRSFPVNGRVIWGARTLRGADQLADEWKYIPVRRTALFIEESLYRGTQWVVFEPNDEPLWAQIRLNVGAFMHNLFRQGAFQGSSPKEAYFVKCDKETTPQNDIDRGIVNIVVGFAPLKPAEFVVIKLQQIAGELEV